MHITIMLDLDILGPSPRVEHHFHVEALALEHTRAKQVRVHATRGERHAHASQGGAHTLEALRDTAEAMHCEGGRKENSGITI